MGMLYLFELPFVIFGIYLLAKTKNKASLFILAYLLLAPLAAAPATPNPHGNRSLPMIVGFEMIVALSIVTFLSKIKYRTFYAVFIFSAVAISFIVYIHNYYAHYPIEKASFWQYGFKEAVFETQKSQHNYEKIFVDKSIEQGYVFWLFYNRYDPVLFQSGGSSNNFSNYYFGDHLPQNERELLVSVADTFPQDFEVTRTIYYPDDKPAIKIGHP